MRNLPILGAFRHSLRSTMVNLPFAFHLSWPWMALLLPINIAGNIFIISNQPADPNAFEGSVLSVTLAMGIAALIAFASIAVNWHRYILLDEVPHGLQRVRLDETVWRYFGNTILIGLLSGLYVILLALVPLVVFSLIAGVSTFVAALVGVPVGIIILVLFLSFAYRLSIKLPAIALGRRDFSMANARAASAGNTWQVGLLVVLVFICLTAFGLLFAGLTYGFGQVETPLALSTLIIVQMAVNWVATIWNVTLLTSLYGFFCEQRDF